MIIGIGSDLIDIRRIEKTLERFGDRFTERVFTEVERQKSDRRFRSFSTRDQINMEATTTRWGGGLSQ